MYSPLYFPFEISNWMKSTLTNQSKNNTFQSWNIRKRKRQVVRNIGDDGKSHEINMLIFIQWTQRFDSVREKEKNWNRNLVDNLDISIIRWTNTIQWKILSWRVLLILLSDKSFFIRINTSSGEKTINHVVTTNCLIVIWFYIIKSKPFLLKMHFINFIWHHLQLINEIKCKTARKSNRRDEYDRARNH